MSRDTDAASLWAFSLRVYQQPGVEQACLDLQDDADFDVNLLLFCLWAGLAQRVRLDDVLLSRAAHAARPWQEEVVEPIRRLRRSLKSGIPGVEPGRLEAVRRQLADAELAGERMEQECLVAAVAGRLPPPEAGTGPCDLAAANLQTLARQKAAAPGSTRQQDLLNALLLSAGAAQGL